MTGTTLFFPTYPTMPHMTSPHPPAADSQLEKIQITRLDAAIYGPLRTPPLLLDRIPVFFNDRIRKHFSRNTFHLSLSFLLAQAAVQGDLEILSLAHLIKPLVTHLFQCTLNGFSLRIEHTLLQRHVHVGFHGTFIISQQELAVRLVGQQLKTAHDE